MKAIIVPYLIIFLSSFTVALSGAMMPGPLLTTTITESLRRGFIAGPLLVAGHGILEIALLFALLLGLSPLFSNKWFFVSVSLAGGAILLFMAWSVWRDLPTLELSAAAGESGEDHNLILKGIAVSIANPYFTIWWATIGIGYIMHSLPFGPSGIAAFFTGHIFADLVWYSAISLGLAKGKTFLNLRLYRGIMAASALLLAFFACWFIYSGMARLS